jgi:hypothetical protein
MAACAAVAQELSNITRNSKALFTLEVSKIKEESLANISTYFKNYHIIFCLGLRKHLSNITGFFYLAA